MLKKGFILSFFCFLLMTCALFPLEEKQILKRVQSHVLLKDYFAAEKECEFGLIQHQNSTKILEEQIKVLSHAGKSIEAIESFQSLVKINDSYQTNYELLESIAWGVMHEAESSDQLNMNLAALVGAFYTRDIRAVSMIYRALMSTNAFVRSLGVKLSIQFRDSKLIEKLKQMLTTEKYFYVRVEIIEALGALKIKGVESVLKEIIAKKSSYHEEKTAAIHALVMMHEDIAKEALISLVNSKRSADRMLACHLVEHLDAQEFLLDIKPLMDDKSPEVRFSCLHTFGALWDYLPKEKEVQIAIKEKIIEKLEDSHPFVAIQAAWSSLKFHEKKALAVFKKWVFSSYPESRRMAAHFLALSGEYGKKLKNEVLSSSLDPYVRVNVAYGMCGYDPGKGAEVIFQFLQECREKIMFDGGMIQPSRVYHTFSVSQYPTMVDQMSRLHLLNVLAVVKHPKAKEAIKSYLQEKVEGITFNAAMALLQEGDPDAVDLVRELLTDKEENVRLQAAFILALKGGDEEALEVLKSLYHQVPREMKVNIISAIGNVGKEDSIPFLLQVLKEPFKLLKLVASSSMIQCVYH